MSRDLPSLKRYLRQQGWDVFRTQADAVVLAERVRDNLILDSGIAVSFHELADAATPLAEGYSIRVTVRAQNSHFPGAPEEQVRKKAEDLAAAFLALGYTQHSQHSQNLPDPNAPERKLDTLHAIQLERQESTEDGCAAALRAAFALPRATSDE